MLRDLSAPVIVIVVGMFALPVAIVVCLFWFYSNHRCVEEGDGMSCVTSGSYTSCTPTRVCVAWERK